MLKLLGTLLATAASALKPRRDLALETSVLEKDTPEAREVQPPMTGKVVALSQVGGFHHRYERCAA